MNLRRLDAYFRRLVEEGLLPGAVVLVARGGEVVFQGVYGYLDPGRGLPMREDALFRLYSMTKPWVSALALSFVEEGTLSLLDPVEKYLPEFSGLRVGREVGGGDRLRAPEAPPHRLRPPPPHRGAHLRGLLPLPGEGALPRRPGWTGLT